MLLFSNDQYQLSDEFPLYNPNEIFSDLFIQDENIINIKESSKDDDMNIYFLYCKEKQTTKWTTLKKNNIFSNGQQSNKEDETKYNYIPLEEIKENLIKFTNSSEIGEKLIKNEIIEDIEKKLCKIKRKRDTENKNEENNGLYILIKEEDADAGEKIKRGRKIKIIRQSKIEHNKYSQDNIIKKIKSKLLLYPLIFLNKLLESSNYNKKKYKLYKLDHKYIKNIKKEEELNILKKSLKDLYSLDVSSKFKNISIYHNKNIIDEIINNKELKNYEAINFAFNLNFKEWIELFIYKKSINEIKNSNNNIIKEIEKNIIYVESLLTEIKEKNDENFYSIFTFLLYNYEEWFSIKTEKIRGKNKKIK